MFKTPILFVLSVLGFALGYVFLHNYEFGLCYFDIASNTYDVSCSDLYREVGLSLYYGMGALAIVFLALIFAPKAWGAWKKFAIWFVPIAALIFVFYKDPGSMNLFSPYAETVFMWLSGIYVVFSLAIIGFSTSKKS